MNNPLLSEVAKSIQKKEIHGIKIHDTICQDLTEINNRIQDYENALDAIEKAKESLLSLEKSIDNSTSNYLLQRIHQSKISSLQETPKLFVVKAPKNGRKIINN